MRVWRRGSINRSYVSGLDRFLLELNKRYAETDKASFASRRAEEALYARIKQLRDSAEGK